MGITCGQIRVLIADKHAMFREALSCVLAQQTDLRLAGEAADGAQVLERVKTLKPDILLLDLELPLLSGTGVLQVLAREPQQTRTILLIDSAEQDDLVEALKLGARGILSKQTTPALLFKCIRTVAAGQFWIGQENITSLIDHLRARPAQPAPPPQSIGVELTRRESEIVASIIDGATNKQIAQSLSISEQTVKHHLTSVFAKVGVTNRLELAMVAMQNARRERGQAQAVAE